jgi:hypothetical protein
MASDKNVVRIESNGVTTSVVVNGHDISDAVMSVELKCEAGEEPTALVRLLPDVFELVNAKLTVEPWAPAKSDEP